jgi:hypothetical protein
VRVGFSGNLFQWITSFDWKQHHQTTISRCTKWRISTLGADPGHANRRCFILNLDPLDNGIMATQVGSLLWISEFALTILRIRPKLQLQREHQRANRWDYPTTEFIFLSQGRANTTNCPTKISTYRNHISACNIYYRPPHLYWHILLLPRKGVQKKTSCGLGREARKSLARLRATNILRIETPVCNRCKSIHSINSIFRQFRQINTI